MSDSITFVKTRHPYQSYADYWKLVELSGFPVIYVDEVPPEGVKDNVYIVTPFNQEWEHGIPTDGRVILWDLEYHLEANNRLPELPNVERWAGDKWYAEQIGAKYVPMGSHVGLNDDVMPNSNWHDRTIRHDLMDRPEEYDVAFIGYIEGIHRRQVIRQQLIERGVKVSPHGAWGDQRHRILSKSRAYLHVHQRDDAPTIAPLRMVVAAAYMLPVFSETVIDAGIFSDLIFQADYDDIADYCRDGVGGMNIAMHTSYGLFLHERLCEELTFRKSIESAL